MRTGVQYNLHILICNLKKKYNVLVTRRKLIFLEILLCVGMPEPFKSAYEAGVKTSVLKCHEMWPAGNAEPCVELMSYSRCHRSLRFNITNKYSLLVNVNLKTAFISKLNL
jgi:hypothetical protein